MIRPREEGSGKHSIIRIISKHGLCSRKQAVELVRHNKVTLNGRPVLHPGERAALSDVIHVDGRLLAGKKKLYILFHKPPGYVTTRKDELGRDTVYRFLEGIGDWVFPVGRLDKDSEGLLLFTNDSRFAERLADPKFEVPRSYLVTLDGPLSAEETAEILRGVDIGRGEVCRPRKVRIIGETPKSVTVELTLAEGMNREIRRLFKSLGKRVLRLVRTRFGPFELGSLKPGKWRLVRPDGR
ncbi:MAG TPA: pseudouridine synthase [Spirochaetia bacterium]|nr:pseudouridine synthase [Spirochaetia bacterium]